MSDWNSDKIHYQADRWEDNDHLHPLSTLNKVQIFQQYGRARVLSLRYLYVHFP